MKYLLIILLLSSCIYNDICQRDIKLKLIDQKINNQLQVIKKLEEENLNDNTDDIFIEQSNLEDLLMEKTLIQLQDCK